MDIYVFTLLSEYTDWYLCFHIAQWCGLADYSLGILFLERTLYVLQRAMADVRPKSRSQDGEASSAPLPHVGNRDSEHYRSQFHLHRRCSSPQASVVLDGEDKAATPVKEYQLRDTTVSVGSRQQQERSWRSIPRDPPSSSYGQIPTRERECTKMDTVVGTADHGRDYGPR